MSTATVETLRKPKGTPKQLNVDDVFGTNIGFVDSDFDAETEEKPSDFEVFANMCRNCYFTNELVERKGICQINDSALGDCFDMPTKEIVLVEANGIRTVAMFCESDESLLGFLTETVNEAEQN